MLPRISPRQVLEHRLWDRFQLDVMFPQHPSSQKDQAKQTHRQPAKTSEPGFGCRQLIQNASGNVIVVCPFTSFQPHDTNTPCRDRQSLTAESLCSEQRLVLL